MSSCANDERNSPKLYQSHGMVISRRRDVGEAVALPNLGGRVLGDDVGEEPKSGPEWRYRPHGNLGPNIKNHPTFPCLRTQLLVIN